MIIVAVIRTEDGTLELMARFEADGIIGDGFPELHPGEEYLRIPFEVWEEHAGHLVEVQEDGSLIRR